MNSITSELKQKILEELQVLQEESTITWLVNGYANTLEEAIAEAEEGKDVGLIATAQVGFHIVKS